MKQPVVVVLGGPNGAGKSTAASGLLPPGVTFLNADEVAKALPDYPSPATDLWAGRLVLERMDELESKGEDFAVETTLASRSLAVRVERLQRSGYFFRLIFLWTPSAEFSIQRVADRVRMGGHAIPEGTIRRRYAAGLKNFFELYQPVADAWVADDNSGSEGFRPIAEGLRGHMAIIHDSTLWDDIRKRHDHGR